MRSDEPVAGDDDHRVIKFRPRSSETLHSDTDIVAPDEPDDFAHRMWTNAAALAFTAVLVGAGIWLAISIADLRASQDCLLMGRRDCARVSDKTMTQTPVEPDARRH